MPHPNRFARAVPEEYVIWLYQRGYSIPVIRGLAASRVGRKTPFHWEPIRVILQQAEARGRVVKRKGYKW